MDTTNIENVFVQIVQVQEPNLAEAQARGKVASCGFKAFMVFLQTRDQAQAMTAFISCLFGVGTPPVNPNPPDSGSPTNPGSVNRVVLRCS